MISEKGVAILAVDCAWSNHNPSGIVSGLFRNGKFEQHYLASSCAEVLGLGSKEGWPTRRQAIEDFKREFCSVPRIICADIPLSHPFQKQRRVCDNEVSRFFGRAYCSTHSISCSQLEPVKEWNHVLDLDVHLCVSRKQVDHYLSNAGCALIETYPHPAILGLLNIKERLCYKVGRRRKYWPNEGPSQRKSKLCAELSKLKDELSCQGFNTSAVKIGEELPLRLLKSAEDMLDALVCAWVAVKVISADARPVSEDKTSTIWLPNESFNVFD